MCLCLFVCLSALRCSPAPAAASFVDACLSLCAADAYSPAACAHGLYARFYNQPRRF